MFLNFNGFVVGVLLLLGVVLRSSWMISFAKVIETRNVKHQKNNVIKSLFEIHDKLIFDNIKKKHNRDGTMFHKTTLPQPLNDFKDADKTI